MNKILEAIYDNWTDTYRESYEINEIFEILTKLVEGDVQKANRLHDTYAEAVSKEQHNAFYAGFYSAVELLVTRGGKV
ncbi:MAG: hypothetical protein K2K57_03025 [Oscillospiraceae bacterium]|nr:hypothetical protein [Oscillospiraceae bacterium]